MIADIITAETMTDTRGILIAPITVEASIAPIDRLTTPAQGTNAPGTMNVARGPATAAHAIIDITRVDAPLPLIPPRPNAEGTAMALTPAQMMQHALSTTMSLKWPLGRHCHS